MRDVPPDLYHRLLSHGQEHVLQGWEELSCAERIALTQQLSGIDLAEIARLYQKRDELTPLPDPDDITPVPMRGLEGRSAILDRGCQALTRGEVAVLLVAGGQGSRLGFDRPKGMFPIGPVSGKSLFQIHAEKVFALTRRFGNRIPFLIMTSPATHDDTERFFEEHRYFGLPRSSVYFFQQGTMPAVELSTGRLLMEKRGVIFTSPNGHGGALTALVDTGLLDELKAMGIRSVYYFQVDNPLVKIADPYFLGMHLEDGSEASSKAIEKAFPKERMGVLSLIRGRCGIIEYSDMPEQLIHALDHQGRLLHRAGSPAIHIFDLAFLERVTRGASRLPFHIARKKVPCLGPDGVVFHPVQENALKFEMFVFDALPLADRWLVLETSRREEFSPIKNADGVDSPATARQAMLNLAGDWLERSGVVVARDQQGNVVVPVEISPLFAIDVEELRARVSPGRTIQEATLLE